MPRQFTTYQFDLFSGLRNGKTAEMPQWQATRQALTALIVRLLVDHANRESFLQEKEAGDDS